MKTDFKNLGVAARLEESDFALNTANRLKREPKPPALDFYDEKRVEKQEREKKDRDDTLR